MSLTKEIRSEEVQEVMGRAVMDCTVGYYAVVALVVGSCFFRYPDVIKTEMVLSGQQPVAQLVARTSGKISNLYVNDGEREWAPAACWL